MQTNYIVTLRPGHYVDRCRVISAHVTLDAARRAQRRLGPHTCVRQAENRKGSEFFSDLEHALPPLNP